MQTQMQKILTGDKTLNATVPNFTADQAERGVKHVLDTTRTR